MYSQRTISLLLLLLVSTSLYAQTKRIKRPKSSVGISSVDSFVRNSFDIYDKVYRYDSYAKNGTPLDDHDIDVLEDALRDAKALLNSAPNILRDLDGAGALKQAKATLQINKAKKALKYSVKTASKLLSGQKSGEEKDEDSSTSDDTNDSNSDEQEETVNSDSESSKNSGSFKVNSKFDFVPGDELLFFDDFSNDFVGDFPSKWNTNGSGEIITVNNEDQKWLKLLSGAGTYYTLNDVILPEEYTIEFDLLANGLDNKTSSTAKLLVLLSDDPNFKKGGHYVEAWIPFGQYTSFGFQVRNHFPGQGMVVNNNVTADIRSAVKNRPHVSIAVNKERFRLWINDKKHIDIPKMIAKDSPIDYFKIHLTNFKDGKESLFISNIKIAEGGVDLRRKLIREGRVSTNGILFNSGSAIIQPQSYGILRQISQVLKQESAFELKIIGHTDSDGTVESNMTLSRKRAEAVKNALIKTYGISGDRLISEGMGESNPITENSTSEGKSQNRRVEFIRILR